MFHYVAQFLEKGMSGFVRLFVALQKLLPSHLETDYERCQITLVCFNSKDQSVNYFFVLLFIEVK